MSRRKWARKLFIHFEKKPKKFIRICHLATKIKLIRPKVYSFVQKFTDDPILFNRASKSWRGFRMVQPNEELIKDFFHKNPIYFKIIMGRYDQVIRTKQAVRFLKRIEQEKALIEVDCGHDFFGENFKEKLERIIQIPPS